MLGSAPSFAARALAQDQRGADGNLAFFAYECNKEEKGLPRALNHAKCRL